MSAALARATHVSVAVFPAGEIPVDNATAARADDDTLVALALDRLPMASKEIAEHLAVPIADVGGWYAPGLMPVGRRLDVASLLITCSLARSPIAEALIESVLRFEESLTTMALAMSRTPTCTTGDSRGRARRCHRWRGRTSTTH